MSRLLRRAVTVLGLAAAFCLLSAASARSAARFTEDGKGGVLDTQTGLLWTKNAEYGGGPLPYQVALQRLREMNEGKLENFGYTDWRLPTVEELGSLVEPAERNPALAPGAPFLNVRSEGYWTSTGGINMIGYVWVVDLAAGVMRRQYVSYCNFNYLWPVRTGAKPSALAAKAEKLGQERARRLPTEVDLVAEAGSCAQPAPLGGRMVGPSGLTALGISDTEITLAWQPLNDPSVAWYNAYEGLTLVGSTPGISMTIEGLEPGTRKCFAVSSFSRTTQESELSREACASTWNYQARDTVWAMGLNEFGQLGDGSRDDRGRFVLSSGITDVADVAAGIEHSLAVKSDGSVWAWGRNTRGQLGDGTKNNAQAPRLVPGLSDIRSVAAGWYHSLALTAEGTVLAWGRNYYGQLGDGTTDDRPAPVLVKGLSSVTGISAGWYHSLALTSDGSVWVWGWNYKGQAGEVVETERKEPYRVPGLADAVGIAGGMYHSVALTAEGTVWAWGRNDYGQLGDGTSNFSQVPVRVRGLEEVAAVSCGMYYCIARKRDGSLWGWGRNDYGQLGLQAPAVVTSPVRVAGIEDVAAVAAGAHHAMALRSDGTLWLWGWNYADNVRSAPPTLMGSLKGVRDMAAGVNFTLMLKR